MLGTKAAFFGASVRPRDTQRFGALQSRYSLDGLPVSPISDERRQESEAWLAAVRSFVDEMAAGFSFEERRNVDQLVNHSEAPEGLRELAWMLEDRDGSIPSDVVERLLDLAGGIVLAERFPPSVQRHLKARGQERR